jgi:hypothetical protein
VILDAYYVLIYFYVLYLSADVARGAGPCVDEFGGIGLGFGGIGLGFGGHGFIR